MSEVSIIKTHLCFSLAWHCSYCNKRIPVLTATDDNWLICPECGTKYDMKDSYLSPSQRDVCVKLDSAGIPYVGAKIQ